MISTKVNCVYGMCFVQDGDKQLLVYTAADTICDNGKFFVYNMAADKLEWKVGGNLPGMSKKMFAGGIVSDGQGHLFVCDGYNSCIQIFSVVDGQYLGCLTKDLKDLGQSYGIFWSEKASSVVFSCRLLEKPR